MRNFFLTISLLVAAQCLAGCGGEKAAGKVPVFPVAGKVNYNGKPVADADVTFFCKERNMSSFAKTDAQGKFRLTSYASFDGAPAGKHQITVVKVDALKGAGKDVPVEDPAYDPLKLVEDAKAPPPKNLIPLKYADATSTDLTATVTADKKNADVVIELKD